MIVGVNFNLFNPFFIKLIDLDTIKNQHCIPFRNHGQTQLINVRKTNPIIILHYQQDSSFIETWACSSWIWKSRGWKSWCGDCCGSVCIFAPTNVYSVIHTQGKKYNPTLNWIPVQLTFKSVLHRMKSCPCRTSLRHLCSLQKPFCGLDHWQKAIC